MKFVSHSVEETENIAKELASHLSGTEAIAFFGGLGMGKTAFTRGLMKGLDFPEGVQSPTFSLVNQYSGKFTVYHFDMYRINTYDDLYSTGFFDYLDTGILVIEWSENIENVLPDNFISIEITGGSNENERIINIEGIEY
jgi:tRNA threonylcarbamoyladenosine biosynthesis protein TsaE